MAAPSGPRDPFDYSEYEPPQRRGALPEEGAAGAAGRYMPEQSLFTDPMEPGPTTRSSLAESISQSTGNPPMHWLVLAALFVGSGIATAIVVGRSPVALAAWALDGPLAIGVLALFTRADLEQRTRIFYRSRVYATPLYAVVLTAAAAGVFWSGWLFANWLARR